MCVTSGPAELGKTTVAAWEITFGVHALGYQNRVKSLIGVSARADIQQGFYSKGFDEEVQPRLDWDSEGYELKRLSSANCMILPIPLHPDAKVKDIAIVDTRKFKNCLRDMAEAVNDSLTGARGAKSIESYGAPRGEVYVMEFDVYSIVLAQFAGDAFLALEAIPTSRRPDIKEALLNSYEEWYGWPVALCCFDNVEAKDAAPLIFTFPTRFPTKLFLPALHGHDGGVPDLYAQVEDDHTYIGGCLSSSKGEPVTYTDNIDPEAAKLLPTSVVGTTANYYHKQGDVVLDLEKVRLGVFELNRLLPPHAPRLPQQAKDAENRTQRSATRSSPW